MNIGTNGIMRSERDTGADEYAFFRLGNRRPKKNKPQKFRFIYLAVFQCVVCAVVAAAVFVNSKLGTDDLPKTQSGFDGALNGHKTIVEQTDSVNGVIYSASDFETVTAKITVDSEKTANTTLDDTVAVGKIIGGGEDIGSEQAIKGTTFASYTVSAPVTVPVEGRLTSPFGYRTNPVSGKYGFHTGIDLAAPEGTPVAAAYGGRVTDSGENDVWGKYVLVEHSDGFETYYCHLSEIYAPQETVLRKGETLGLVGSTGWSTGPHLHFEVRIDGVRVDPEPLIYPDEN